MDKDNLTESVPPSKSWFLSWPGMYLLVVMNLVCIILFLIWLKNLYL